MSCVCVVGLGRKCVRLYYIYRVVVSVVLLSVNFLSTNELFGELSASSSIFCGYLESRTTLR